jgi:hypothetical protein
MIYIRQTGDRHQNIFGFFLLQDVCRTSFDISLYEVFRLFFLSWNIKISDLMKLFNFKYGHQDFEKPYVTLVLMEAVYQKQIELSL